MREDVPRHKAFDENIPKLAAKTTLEIPKITVQMGTFATSNYTQMLQLPRPLILLLLLRKHHL